MRISAIIILIFIGLNAIGGGTLLMIDPSGASMQFPLSMLETTPFKNYFLPGLILFLGIGVLSFLVAIWVIKRKQHYPFLIIIQSLILFTWLTIEIILNPDFYHPWYHLPLYLLSGWLIFVGYTLKKYEIKRRSF